MTIQYGCHFLIGGNNVKYVKYIQSPVGTIGIVEENKKIIKISIKNKIEDKDIEEKETLLLKKAKMQLMQYFEGKREDFELPLNPQGTTFMKQVWKALEKIPYGETNTYKQIAENIQNPKAVRAVGMANHRNPIPIIIPCHRIIGSNGKLVGYALGLEMKQFLLNLEKNNK